jgi:DNA-directed RNA polymerase subunit RPC12/RpoP
VTEIPRGTYSGRPVGEQPKDEADHYIRCPGCGGCRLPRSRPSLRARRAVAASGAGSAAVTGAQFEIRIDGTPQQITYAMELAVVQSSDLKKPAIRALTNPIKRNRHGPAV